MAIEKFNKRILAKIIFSFLMYDFIFVKLIYEAEDQAIYSLFLPHQIFRIVESQMVVPKDTCKNIGNCEHNGKYSMPICYCDLPCKEYHDCCFDAPPTDTLTSVTRLYDKEEFMTCEYKLLKIKYYGLWMVSKCPLSYTMSDISDKCTAEEIKHPVTADHDGTAYRNVYCAICHNISKVTMWRFEFWYEDECLEGSLKSLNTTISKKMRFLIENKCKYQFIPSPNSKIRTCFNLSTSNDLCSSYQSPLIVDNKIYKNTDCVNQTGISISCILPLSKRVEPANKGHGDISLTGIFKINPVIDWFGSKRCYDNDYYHDVKTDTCLPQTCIKTQSEECGGELIRNYKVDMKVEFVTDDIINKNFILRLLMFIYLSLPIDAFRTALLFVFGNYTCGTNLTDKFKPCCITKSEIKLNNPLPMTVEKHLKFEAELQEMTWQYQEIHNEKAVSAINALTNRNITNMCVGTEQYQRIRALPISLEIFETEFANFKMDKEPLIPEHIKGVIVLSDEIQKSVDGNIPKIKSAYFDIQYKKTNKTINENENLVIGKTWSVGTIMTYVTIGCSCFCLILTLGVYGCLGLFESSQGVISKHMMINMLAAQMLFIVGVGANYVKEICTIIGIVSHYFWLSSFTWVSLFLFSILKMMRQLSSCPGDLVKRQNLSKVVYCFGYMIPFLIVLPCALLEYLTEIHIGYSGQICFLSGFLANLFSFTLPVIISLSFNIIALVVSSFSLARYNITAKRIHTVRKARSFIPIYIRLTILCACPWLLGIIGDVLRIEVLNYAFILLSGSHGTFVGISFLCSENVRKFVWRNNDGKSRNQADIELK